MEFIIEFKWPITFLIALLILLSLFKREVAEFLREISWLKTKWFELGRIREEIFAKAEEVKKLSKELNIDKREFRQSTRIFIETLYLTLSSRHRFPIPEKISNEITKNLNTLANLGIRNQKEEKKWKKRLEEVNKLLEAEVR